MRIFSNNFWQKASVAIRAQSPLRILMSFIFIIPFLYHHLEFLDHFAFLSHFVLPARLIFIKTSEWTMKIDTLESTSSIGVFGYNVSCNCCEVEEQEILSILMHRKN